MKNCNFLTAFNINSELKEQIKLYSTIAHFDENCAKIRRKNAE